jgi:hypothetical protein
MKNLASRKVLACMLSLMPTVAAFGQQTANQGTNVQIAVTYVDRGFVKQRKGDLDGAMADCNQAINLSPNPQGDALFRDIESIPVGIDFPNHIKQVVSSCCAVLVVTGHADGPLVNSSGFIER